MRHDEAVIGNSTGAVLTMRTTLPDPRAEVAEEGAVEAILRVELDDLLVVVGALQQLDARVQRPAALEGSCTLSTVGSRVGGGHRPGRSSTRRGTRARSIDALGDDVGGERELGLADVADGNRV